MDGSLTSYYLQKIAELTLENKNLKDKITTRDTFIYELCDKDCPEEYKHVVKQQVFYDE
jgi:hypothetical protein